MRDIDSKHWWTSCRGKKWAPAKLPEWEAKKIREKYAEELRIEREKREQEPINAAPTEGQESK